MSEEEEKSLSLTPKGMFLCKLLFEYHFSWEEALEWVEKHPEAYAACGDKKVV